MRENEIEESVETFARATVRNIIMPAVCLALIGCSGSSSDAQRDAVADGPERSDTANLSLDGSSLAEDVPTIQLDTNGDSTVVRVDARPDSVIRDARADTVRDATVADRRDTSPRDSIDSMRLDIAMRQDTARADTRLDAAVDSPATDAAAVGDAAPDGDDSD